jgi:uncharacterized membrane protein
MTRTAVRPILVTLPVAWLTALLVAVFLASRPSLAAPLYAASAAVYQIGSLICHQLPKRSFYFWGAQLPVCARCTGLYFGAAAAALTGARMGRALQRRVWDRARQLLFIGVFPTGLTLIYEWVSGNMPGHWIRAAAGFPLGAIVMLIVLAATATPAESAVGIH